MEQNSFINLPSELTTNILPLRSISISKCVCKPWLNLLQSDDFPKSKIKTPPVLARLIPTENNSIRCKIFEFEDKDKADVESHALHLHQLIDLGIPCENSESIHLSRAGDKNPSIIQSMFMLSPVNSQLHDYAVI
ncbi:uncharacterized protein LOC121779643 isoform X1 [Salvia splendens]|uniref:uncharacterized protein LOC121779643 isoform X1 n=1 Tax=Salvia splendens TaxID=180675 RepID=UPI001C25BB57|nr:uncharacterized protein LOC121779643 isoform X1 [Salvia splendens]